MNTRSAIDDFLNHRTLAVVGVSRSGKKFGNGASRELRKKGYQVLPVHPEAESIDGEKCYRSLAELPAQVGGLLLVVPPAETEKVVQQASAAGIRHVWMQQGAESEAAIRYCEGQGISVVSRECILMFAQPAGVHKLHHWFWRVLGKLPN